VAQLVAEAPGDYVVKLTVTDADGPDSAVCVVTVARPTVRLIKPRTDVADGTSIWIECELTDVPADWEATWSTRPEDGAFVFAGDRTGARILPTRPGNLTVNCKLEPPGGTTFSPSEGTVTIDVAEPTDGQPAAADQKWWADKQLKDVREARENVSTSATTWQGYTSGIVGLLATVTIVAGPKSFSDVSHTWLLVVALIMTVLAFGLALAGLWQLASVTAGAPRLSAGEEPLAYRDKILESAVTARSKFELSKILTVSAASVLAAGSLLVLGSAVYDQAQEPAPTLFLVRTDTSTYCGPGTFDPTTGAVTVGGNSLGKIAEFKIVDSCGTDTSDQDEDDD
jgi:hypothetical protein